MTVRHVSKELARALDREKRRRRTSLNQTVLGLLEQGLGVSAPRSNGLARLAGTWTEDEHRRFGEAIAPLDRPDAELWR